jgi:hypothetical protein
VENKMLTKATMLIATFLLAIPFVPAYAAAPASLSIAMPSAAADFGQSFTANVMVSGESKLLGYDITLQYNPDVLTATSASLTGTLFDPATQNVLVVRQDNFPTIGYLRWALVILGGASVSTAGSVLSVNFQVNDPASTPTATASEYPSAIDIVAAKLPSLDSNGNVIAAPFVSAGASYMPPANVALRSVGCRANNNGFNTQAKGFSDPLFCRVVNTGTSSISIRGQFSFTSLGGLTGSVTGPSITLGAGQSGQVNAIFTVLPHTNDIFIFTGSGARTVTFQDGSVLGIAGGSVIFQVTVISP